MRRVPQPLVNPAQRAREHHDFWPAFVGAVAAGVLIVCGAGRLTGIETVDGGTARETQLVKAYTSGGLKFPQQISAPPRPIPGDPAGTAAALERWERESAQKSRRPWKVQVDTTASAPCPT